MCLVNYSKVTINLHTLLTARRMLVGHRTAINNTIRGLLKSFGIHLESSQVLTFLDAVRAKIAEYWPGEKEFQTIALEALTKCFEKLGKEICIIDVELTAIAKKDPIIKRLMTVPGVGVLTAITYKVIVDNPKRFKNPRLVGAYLGMCPKQYSSGQIKRQGRISKRGSKEMRTLLASAGMKLLTHCKKTSILQTWGFKILEKHGKKKAAMAIGRKIAVIMHHIWDKDSIFKY